MENADVIQEILERVVRVETKIDNYNALKDKTDEAFTTSKQNSKDISDIKDNVKWLWRTGLGAVIIVVIGALIKFN